MSARITHELERTSAALLGFGLVAVIQMLSLPVLDKSLTIALYCFTAAVPLLGLFLVFVSENSINTMDELINSFTIGASYIAGTLLALAGVTAVFWHFSIKAGMLFGGLCIWGIVFLIRTPSK